MRTSLCDMFGIEFPIFAFTHCRDVVAAVSKAGGFGVLGALAFSPEQLELELKWIDENVDGKPYGVDVVMPANYVGRDDGDLNRGQIRELIPDEHKKFLNDLLEEYGVPELPEDMPSGGGVGMGGGMLGWSISGGTAAVEVSLKHPVKLLVNALGPPPKEIVDLAHEQDVKVGALVGRIDQALKQKEQGVDIIIAQGTEAGGHTGEIGSMVLIPDIVDAVSPSPVLGAGGIGSGRQAAAALALGAEGIWTGSIWLTVEESEMTGGHVMDKLLAAGSKDAVRSRTLSGKPARLLKTAWTEAWLRDDCPGTLPMPLQYMACAEAQTRIGLAARNPDSKARELVGMPVGQVVSRMNEVKKSSELIYELIEEFVDTVQRLDGLMEAAERTG